MADDEQDIRRVTRFPKGADAHVKRQFAQTLVAALDELGVEPGHDDVEAAENKAHRERDEEAIEVLYAVYDHQRGMIDLEEAIARIRHALRKVLTELDTDAHVAIGLGHTGQVGA
jgi:hypothetical protein